ncbi:response regulator transcription factor [Alkalibacillus haloalkaliphilus]|uniref:response regulator transcription factor n=1 Tax=Alkalibacillus haloalkaliphilus TaxID=94136 RepID=UPI0029369763|nr:response regulator transcription factor [Alkalibacillus haloalkaliphilus]MDV2583367.1 response regulator transcription factor [Alkalibacillus haloalkaliphilus]
MSETILLVEDEAGIRDMTQMYLGSKGYKTLAAQDGDEALEIIDKTPPELILLDIEMPGMNGFEVCQKIREQLTIPIIFLSVRRNTFDKVKCFELGGDDYLTKPYDFEELEARIKANLRIYHTKPKAKNNTLEYGRIKIDLDDMKCYVKDKPITLTTKELELLIHLAEHPNRVWSHEQLYDRIWSYDATGNIETVKVHISHLRSKVEENPHKPHYIQTVRGFGYKFNAED